MGPADRFWRSLFCCGAAVAAAAAAFYPLPLRAAGPPPAALSRRAGGQREAIAIKNWSARKPVLLPQGKLDWTAAPEFLQWRAAGPADPVRGNILSVTLVGPFSDAAWSQHAGALMTLNQTVRAGQVIEISFKARSLAGSKYLSVLRSWGGARPWDAYAIAADWQACTVRLTPDFPTDTITFSLVPRAGGLQPYCAGQFELAEVQVRLPAAPAKAS